MSQKNDTRTVSVKAVILLALAVLCAGLGACAQTQVTQVRGQYDVVFGKVYR